MRENPYSSKTVRISFLSVLVLFMQLGMSLSGRAQVTNLKKGDKLKVKASSVHRYNIIGHVMMMQDAAIIMATGDSALFVPPFIH